MKVNFYYAIMHINLFNGCYFMQTASVSATLVEQGYLNKEGDSHSSKKALFPKAGRRIVFSGGSGNGKSTVIELLSAHGYHVVHEVYTSLATKKVSDFDIKVDSTSVVFREKLLNIQVAEEDALDASCDAFLDRSTIDWVAFGYYNGVVMPDELVAIPRIRRKYDTVFFFDPVPPQFYKQKAFSPCDQIESAKIHDFLRRSYEDMGYVIIDVPFNTPQERVKYILRELGK